jgi:predicted nucleotidyltransferase
VETTALRPADLDRIVHRHPAMSLMVLLGSRAGGTAHSASDWDVGVLAEGELDLATLAADLMDVWRTDDVDVVDLARASAVLRRDAAAQGVLLWEQEPGAFMDFAVEATIFWCDVEPVLRRAHADVLRSVTT